jgi:hypothetical protein
MPLKNLPYILILLLCALACKKSKDARQLEKYLSDTRWEFYYAEDAQGNDITAQVLQDSVICECFEFLKDDKDPVTFNTNITRCKKTFFDNYKGNWGVFDYKKLELRYDPESSSKWMSHALSVGNIGLESNNASSYLRQVYFNTKVNDEIMISKRYKLESTGLPSDSLMEIRYYKKI